MSMCETYKVTDLVLVFVSTMLFSDISVCKFILLIQYNVLNSKRRNLKYRK